MSRAVILLVLAACGGDREATPPTGATTGSSAAPVVATLVGCAPAPAAPHDPRTLRATNRPPPARRAPRAWTPYAAADPAEPARARAIADEVASAIRVRLPVVEACFEGARGMARALLAIRDGRVHGMPRVGGLGERRVEACLASLLAGLALPASGEAEVACDLARGGDAPLRVSPDAGYAVIAVTRDEVRHGTDARRVAAAAAPPAPLATREDVLIVAAPETPGHALAYALAWAPPTSPTLVAVAASGGAPVVLGAGDARNEPRLPGRVVELRTDGGTLRACIDGTTLPEHAPLLDARAMDRVLAAVRDACLVTPCAPTVIVGTDGAFVAKDLVASASAARRAGFTGIAIGGAACAAAGSP